MNFTPFFREIVLVGGGFFACCAWAGGASSNWSEGYSFPSPTRAQTNMVQADLIKKMDTGYYDRVGGTTVYQSNVSTTTIGTMTQETVTIDGSGNDVSTTSASTGNLDASVGIGNNGFRSNAGGGQ